MSKSKRIPYAVQDANSETIIDGGNLVMSTPSLLRVHMAVATPQGWVSELKRYVNELDNQAYVTHHQPKPGDLVVEETTIFRTAAKMIFADMITVGTWVKFVPMTQENSELEYVGAIIRLPNGEVECWGDAKFLVLPDPFAFIYQNFIYQP